MNAKKLHKHALPIVSLAVAGLVLSAVGAASVAALSLPSHDALVSSLTSHAVTIDVSTNGLATVHSSHQQAANSDPFADSSNLVESTLQNIAHNGS